MRIAYVLPFPELNGGNKVIFQHVGLLAERGHDVTVLAEGPRPDWIPIAGRYHDLTVGPPQVGDQDLVIATFWTTLERARDLDLGPLAHFCQGYEGALDHLRPQLAHIEEVYSWPVPTLTVSPHLGEWLRARHGRESRTAPPPLDPLFRPRWRWRPRRNPWVAVGGIFESRVKGVRDALAAVAALRGRGVRCRLLRFSILPLSDEERAILAPDAYLCHVPPATIARALPDCDLLLFPSRAAEGFGLPVLEAMSAGVPAIASRIPSMELLAEGVAALVPEGDVEALATAARALLEDPAAWRRARRRGLAAARRFDAGSVAEAVEEAVSWARARAAASPLVVRAERAPV
jgi:glycosyltransferase involved in cell wall biosynthesis